MNKQKFLKDLEKKLTVLSDEEKKDIINEYSDIIDEKVKHGKTEEESVKEFGNIDELAEEILKAYKINPNYNKSDFSEKTNDFIKSSEEFIKKGAKKLTDVTEEIVDGFKKNENELNLTTIFEIIIKVLLILVCLAFLKIPFHIITEVGSGIFGIGFGPFSHFSVLAWKVLVELIYFIVCVLLVVIVVNKYTKKNNQNDKSINNISKTKEEDNIKENIIKEEKSEKINETKDSSNKPNNNIKSNDAFGTFLLIFIKIWCVVLILIPIWFIQIGMVISICVIGYLIIKGISIYGLLLLMIGITSMFGYFADLIYKLLFSKKNIHIYPIFINVFLIVIGGIMTFDYLANLKFANTIPNNFKEVKETHEVKIEENTQILYEIEKEIDNSLENNVLRFEITYYNDVYNTIFVDRDGYNDIIEIDRDYKNKEYSLNNLYLNEFIDNLKENKIYNYSLLWQVKVKVYSNEATINMYE